MQAVIVNPQVDFATVKNPSPQLESTSKVDDFSFNRKSFDRMVQDAEQKTEKPVSRTEPVEKKNEPGEKVDVLEKDNAPEEKTAQTAVEKSSENKKTVEKSKLDTEKPEKESALALKDVKVFEKDNKVEAKDNEVQTKAEVSFETIKKILENSKDSAEVLDEQKTVEIEDIKILLENEDAELLAAVNQSEQMPVIQDQFDSSNFAQISENIFEAGGTEKTSSRNFVLDKEGRIKVQDLRSEKADKLEADAVEKNGKAELKVTDVKINRNNAEMTMEIASSVQQNLVSSSDQAAGATGSNFQAMLANQIQQNAGEFVKAGNIVLKDNDVGSIKLILKPENLGNVKIDLQIHDKSISGRIVVASQEAFNAFKDSAESLRQAFIESGFDSAGLDLSFAGQNNSQNQFAGQENPAKSFAMSRAYGGLVDSSDGTEYETEEIIENSKRNSVNIVA